MKNCRSRTPLGALLLNQPAYCEEPKEYRDMTTERRESRNLGFRVFVFLAVLANLILTVALIAQVREVQQRVENLPPDLASKRDVAALRPLRVRQILTQNCVECHSTRRLGTTVSMEPAEIQRTIERLPSHTSVNIPQDQMERISASLLIARCARCHGEDTLNLMVLKTQPGRTAIIRRMAALPGSGVRADQVLATAQAFEKLIERGDTDSNRQLPAAQASR
jgi:cytochrome c553